MWTNLGEKPFQSKAATKENKQPESSCCSASSACQQININSIYNYNMLSNIFLDMYSFKKEEKLKQWICFETEHMFEA